MHKKFDPGKEKKAKVIYVPVLVDNKNETIIQYDHEYDHRTLIGCQKLCDRRNLNLYIIELNATWKVAKYGRPLLVES